MGACVRACVRACACVRVKERKLRFKLPNEIDFVVVVVGGGGGGDGGGKVVVVCVCVFSDC